MYLTPVSVSTTLGLILIFVFPTITFYSLDGRGHNNSTKILKKIQGIPKSATLKNIPINQQSIANLKNAVRKNQLNNSSKGISSVALDSNGAESTSHSDRKLPRIVEVTNEVNEDGERRTIVLNNLSDDGSEDNKSHRWNYNQSMDQVDEVIEDVYDLFSFLG